MTTLYCPNPLPDFYGLCDVHSMRPLRVAAGIYGITLTGDESLEEIIVLIEAYRAAAGKTDTLVRTFEGACAHCQAGVA